MYILHYKMHALRSNSVLEHFLKGDHQAGENFLLCKNFTLGRAFSTFSLIFAECSRLAKVISLCHYHFH